MVCTYVHSNTPLPFFSSSLSLFRPSKPFPSPHGTVCLLQSFPHAHLFVSVEVGSLGGTRTPPTLLLASSVTCWSTMGGLLCDVMCRSCSLTKHFRLLTLSLTCHHSLPLSSCAGSAGGVRDLRRRPKKDTTPRPGYRFFIRLFSEVAGHEQTQVPGVKSRFFRPE